MKKIILSCFLFSCFFCSWVMSAEHEEKRQAGDRAARLQPEEEGGGPTRSGEKHITGGLLDDDAAAAKGRRQRLKSLSMIDAQNPFTFERDAYADVLVMRGSRLGTGQNISQQLEGVRVLKMVGTNVRDDVIPVTNAIADAKSLECIEISESVTDNTFLFFLGLVINRNGNIKTIIVDNNSIGVGGNIGLKAFLLGIYDKKDLQHFSFRHMDIYRRQVPFDEQYVLRKAGYPSFVEDKIVTDVSGEKEHEIKFYNKLVIRWLAEDFLGAHPNLKTFDITGSFSCPTNEAHKRAVDKIRAAKTHDELRAILAAVSSELKLDTFEDKGDRQLEKLKGGAIELLAQAHMQDREHLFAILDGVATLKNLQVLGLGHIIFDEFAIRKLAHVLAGLRQQQSRDGKTASGNDLKVLHLPGVMKGSQNLSDLARVFSGWVDLEEVNLAHNKIGSKGLHFFGELLNEVRALRVLNVADNDLFAGSGGVTRGIDALSAGILSRKDTLEALNLAGNNMRHTDLSHLEDALKACRSLRVLDLRGNQLTEKSFDLLKGLLKALPQIEQILLSGNNVSRAVYEQRLTLSQKEKIKM